MSDLFGPLRHADSVSAPPVEEVRRRGDRLRRRRTALQTAGAACVVAALVGGGAMLTGGQTPAPPAGPATSSPAPTPTPDAGAARRIPAGFPLDVGLQPGGEVVGPDGSLTFVGGLEICAASYSPADLEVDGLAVTSDGEQGFFQGRELRLFEDAATASEMARDLVAKYEGCPRYRFRGLTVRNTVAAGSLGEESWRIVRTETRPDGSSPGTAVLHVVRVGAALLVAMTSDPRTGGELDPEALTADLAPLVEQMCPFARGGC